MKKNNKTLLFVGILCAVAALVTLFLGSGEGEEGIVQTLLTAFGFLFMVAFAVIICIYEKQKAKELQKEMDEAKELSKVMIESHKDDSPINRIIYDFENKNLPEIANFFKQTSLDAYSFYGEEDGGYAYCLMLEDYVFSKPTKPDLSLSVALMKTHEGAFLMDDEEEKDVSALSKEEILELMVDILERHYGKIVEEGAKDGNVDFEIRNPKKAFNLALGATVISSLVILVLVILAVLKVIPSSVLFVTILPGLFLVIGLLGLWGYARELFTLKDGVFENRGLIKTQSCNAKDVKKVKTQTNSNGIGFYIVFIDENGEELMKFLDDGTAFRSGEFKKSLNFYGIELSYD